MVSKKILAVAIAAAFSSQAFAAVDFNADSPAKSKVAKQALVKTGKETINSADYYLVAQGAKFDTAITVKAGIGITTGQKRYVRVSINGGYFGATAGALTGTAANAIDAVATKIVQGGNAKDNYVVYEVTGGSVGALQGEVLNIAASALLLPATGSIDITYAIYSTIDGAAGDTPAGTPLNTKTVSGIASIVDGLTTTFAPGSTTADVDFSFKKILDVADGDLSPIGKLTIAAADAAKNTGGPVAIADQLDTAATKTKINGDFSVGAFSLNAADDCLGADTPLTPNAAKTSVEVTAAQLIAAPTLCVALADQTKILPAGDFTAVTTVSVGVLDTAFAPTVPNGVIGTIGRNGTTIQVPYLTTFADYTQRLVLVNRGSVAVPYTIAFTPEAGVTAAAGTAATGTLAAGKTTIINAVDIVSLTGKTRTAATVVIAAPTKNIDAATTSVNLSDKSTDTVKLSAN